jgi:tetratricopeptide (TPR) repeat protein
MPSPDQGHKSDSISLDAERVRLRAAGYTDAEISQILIARASQQPAGTGQGVMSNALSSIVAVGSHARALMPTFRHDVATVFDSSATASARASATASLAVKAVVILVLGYAAWQEWRQHIISATEIAASQAEKAHAEACSARIKAIIDTVPMDQVIEATDIVQRDCDPTYAARARACDEKFQAILNDIDHMDANDPDAQKKMTAKINAHKSECVITDAQRQAAAAKFQAESDKTKKTIAALTLLRDSLKADAEFDAGHYDEAYKLAKAHAAAAEAYDNNTTGKPGDITAGALASLSWFALFARQYAEAIAAAERSNKLKPDLVPQSNRAHALMFLGRTAEAKAIYLAHKGEPLNGKTWEEVIVDDFDKLRNAGINNSLMEEIEDAWSSWPPASFRPPNAPGLYDPQGKPCAKASLDCHWICNTGVRGFMGADRMCPI